MFIIGVNPIRILGQTFPVRAKVEHISGFSAHGDRTELLKWLSKIAAPTPRNVFVTHGEPETAAHFAETIRKEKGWSASVPKYGDVAVLD